MKLSQFKFKLPEELIARGPHTEVHELPNGRKFTVTAADKCRLMVLHRATGEIEMFRKDDDGNPVEGNYLEFRDILNYFGEDDAFIFNDSKVFPARLYGTKEKTDAKIEVFLLRELNEEMRLWDVLVEPARKIRIGNKLFFDQTGEMVAEVIDNTTSRGRTLRFLYDSPHEEFKKNLFALGESPIPHYILSLRQKDAEEQATAEGLDKEEIAKRVEAAGHGTEDDMYDFQTVYAKNEGAVTAPATGLHFSRELMKMLEIRGIHTGYITVHCGLGCFHAIEVEDLTKHKMDSEQMIIGAEACRVANTAKQNGHHVCVVGASVLKATETAVGTDGMLKEYDGWTNKFIFPPYPPSMADSMVSNFYHPESTLLMEAAAFGGYENVMKAYNLAVDNGYKFGTFGDALLIV